METKIKLRTHDGSNNYLYLLESPNTYKLVTQLDYIRGGNTSDGKDFIDPSGGPMLVVGDTIEGTDFIIDSISFKNNIGYVITLKTKKNDLFCKQSTNAFRS